jgi:hypothetical protein
MSGIVCPVSGSGTALGLVHFPVRGIYRFFLDEVNMTYEITLEEPIYHSVQVIGDFNEWDFTVPGMTETDYGVWEDTLVVTQGCYRLEFLTDESFYEPPDYGGCTSVDPSCQVPMAGQVCLMESDETPLGYIDFPQTGAYAFRVDVRDNTYEISYLPEVGVPLQTSSPDQVRLFVNHPNPFRAYTTVDYELPEGGAIAVRVLDSSGRLVRESVEGWKESGRHSWSWDGMDSAGRPAAEGIYFFRLDAGGVTRTRKAVLIR